MKNTYRHLLIYPTVILTCLSLSMGAAISQSKPPVKPRATQTNRANSSSSAPSGAGSPTTTTASPSEAPVGDADAKKSESPAANSQEKKDSLSFATVFPWISGFLHLLEAAGLGGLLYLLNRANKDRGVKELEFARRIDNLGTSLQKQDIGIRDLGSNLSAVKQQAAQIQGLERSLSQQQQARELPSPQSYGMAQPASGSAVPMALSEYPFLDLYKQSSETFKSQYSPTVVSESAESFQKRWDGSQSEIILEVKQNGNYWLFSEGNRTYLIPKPKLKVNDVNMRTVSGIFEFVNYSPSYHGFSVVKPAIVSLYISSIEQQWKLEIRGSLEFS
jgi:hypothetical protein